MSHRRNQKRKRRADRRGKERVAKQLGLSLLAVGFHFIGLLTGTLKSLGHLRQSLGDLESASAAMAESSATQPQPAARAPAAR